MVSGAMISGCIGPFSPETTLSPTLLLRGADVLAGAFSSETTRLVTTSQDWAATWSSIFANHFPQPDRPDVDFATSTVVVVAWGTKPTTGYNIYFTGMKGRGDTLIVTANLEGPGNTCATAGVETNPVAIASVPGHYTHVTSELSHTAHNCG